MSAVHRLDRLVSGLLILARNASKADVFRQEVSLKTEIDYMKPSRRNIYIYIYKKKLWCGLSACGPASKPTLFKKNVGFAVYVYTAVHCKEKVLALVRVCMWTDRTIAFLYIYLFIFSFLLTFFTSNSENTSLAEVEDFLPFTLLLILCD